VPKSGYINVEDYSSVEELAKYLTYLSKNKEAYNSYFKWKKHVVFKEKDFIKFNPICSMCIQMQLDAFLGIKKSIVENVEAYGDVSKKCYGKKKGAMFNKKTPSFFSSIKTFFFK